MIMFVRPMHRVEDFVAFWEKLMATDYLDDATEDEWLSAALLRKKDDPSFIRKVGKKEMKGEWSVTSNGKKAKTTLLQFVVDEKEEIFKRWPKFVAVLTDPELYKDKKDTHEGKRIAAEFRNRGSMAA